MSCHLHIRMKGSKQEEIRGRGDSMWQAAHLNGLQDGFLCEFTLPDGTPGCQLV